MATFIARRLIGMVLVLIVVSFFVFLIFIVVPGGDPAARIAGRTANDQNIENIRQTWGFDDPFYVQYVNMMKKALNGLRPDCCEDQQAELRSQTNQLNVVDQIKAGLPATFSLAIGAAVIWLFFGVLVGIIAAVRAGQWSDRLITLVALIGISMPVFWLGIIMRYYFAEGGLMTLFPDGEYVPLTEDPVQWFWHLLLPWFVLAVLFIGFYGRVMRGNILDTINEDYVRTARAKGLEPHRVMRKHVLRNSLIPIVTLFGLDFAAVLGGGAILTETVFDLHGVGQYAAQSIRNFDLPPIMGVTLYGAFFIVLFNAIVDFMYAYLDPRIRPT
jgi:peptide/nickel transport system permease protein